MPFCTSAILYSKIKQVSSLWNCDLGFCNRVILCTACRLLKISVSRRGATTLGNLEEVSYMMKTLKRSEYLLKCFLLVLCNLCGAVAQVLFAFSNALKGEVCVGSCHERQMDLFLSAYFSSQTEIVHSVIYLLVFGATVYLVTSVQYRSVQVQNIGSNCDF